MKTHLFKELVLVRLLNAESKALFILARDEFEKIPRKLVLCFMTGKIYRNLKSTFQPAINSSSRVPHF